MRKFCKRFIPAFTLLFLLITINNPVRAQASKPISDISVRKTKFFIFGHGLIAFIYDHTTIIKYHSGIGGELGFGFRRNENSYVATLGYTLFSGRRDTIKSESYIPIKIGIRHFIIHDLLFLNINGGLAFVTNSEVTPQTPNPSLLRPAADFGVGTVKKNFEIGLSMDFFKEPYPDGGTGTVVLKIGFHF